MNNAITFTRTGDGWTLKYADGRTVVFSQADAVIVRNYLVKELGVPSDEELAKVA